MATPPYAQSLGYQQAQYNSPSYGFPAMYPQGTYGYHMGPYAPSQCPSPPRDGENFKIFFLYNFKNIKFIHLKITLNFFYPMG